MTSVWLAAALRTPVGHRDGALAHLQAWELASRLIQPLLSAARLNANDVQKVVMANALYGGGNPARLAALHAGLPQSVAAISIDSQCCGGLDAITLGAQMIQSGCADVVIAGGLESWSRAPQRFSNPIQGSPLAYNRPPFSPWPDKDPDMLDAAATLAELRDISRQRQEQYAIDSHTRAMAHATPAGLLSLDALHADEYPRNLSQRLCQRLPGLSGQPTHALTAATVASQADAAALVLLLSEKALAKHSPTQHAIRWVDGNSGGDDPCQPALAPIRIAGELLHKHSLGAENLHSVHIMEAFAVQAMAFIDDLNIQAEQCNPAGGALSRGHPIGASGAIEVVNAYHHLQSAKTKSLALCAIAAAGGLGSAALLERP